MVEFVSYDGEWPNLCRGKLVLKIDWQLYDKFELCSGGRCGFLNGYSESYIEKGPWKVDVPEEIEHLKKEIEEVVNENIPEGCCGGCL